MFGNRLRLFRLLGIPISMDLSWLVVLALFTYSFATAFPVLFANVFHENPAQLPPYEYWGMGLVAALAFFACVLLHELGHALVARSRGMPINGITLFLLGGVAEIGEEPPSAGTEFLMAIAGPLVSLFLALLLGLLAAVGMRQNWSHAAVLVLSYLAVLNGLVLVFNLVPAFPLDGGRVLRSLLWGVTGSLRRATYWASLGGQAFAWLLIAWGVVRILHQDLLGGIWLGFIGLFLNGAARSSYQQVLTRQALQGEPVRRFMNTAPVVVPPSLDLLHWVEDYVYRYHRKAFPVVSDGHLEGLATTRALAEMPRAERGQHTVGEVMQRDLDAVAVRPETDALEALGKMQRTGASRLLVTDGDRLVGIVTLKDLLHFLALKLHLEGPDGAASGPGVLAAGTEDEEPPVRR